MVKHGIQRLSPKLKWNMRFSLSSCLKPCVLLMWFIKQLSQPRPPRQMHSIGYEGEIPVEADIATVAPQARQLQISSHPPTPPRQLKKIEKERAGWGEA